MSILTRPFITTPIFYVNASPHLGHLYTSVIADAFCRYQKLKYPHPHSGSKDKDNFNFPPPVFSTGTDEHGNKIEKAATSLGKSFKGHCDQVSSSFRRMADEFGIEYSDFVRTTEDRHKRGVKKFWETLWNNGHIYESEYEGWYSVSDESFVPPSMITEKEGRTISQESGHPVEWMKEQNYIFKLKQFIPEVERWIRKDNIIKPAKFGDILLHWIDEGFEDLSVSRPKARLTWGIPVPNDENQVIYVWLDALINYLTVAGYPDKLITWPPTVQVVGKDILKFHGVYWPAFLMGAGFDPPKEILCHSHWTVTGQKMSKSLGNVVDPFDLAKVYGTEGLRYFLLREGTPQSDANFTEEKMRRMLNAELADTFGNLLSRCSGKAVNPGQKWPKWDPKVFPDFLGIHGNNLKDSLEALPDKVESSYDDYIFYRGLEHIMATIRLANLYVEESKPWILAKKSPVDPQLLTVLSLVFESLRITAIMMWPIIPKLSSSILDRLNVPEPERDWSHIRNFIWNLEETQHSELRPSKSVFYRRVL